jgi:hypothetical protein
VRVIFNYPLVEDIFPNFSRSTTLTSFLGFAQTFQYRGTPRVFKVISEEAETPQFSEYSHRTLNFRPIAMGSYRIFTERGGLVLFRSKLRVGKHDGRVSR